MVRVVWSDCSLHVVFSLHLTLSKHLQGVSLGTSIGLRVFSYFRTAHFSALFGATKALTPFLRLLYLGYLTALERLLGLGMSLLHFQPNVRVCVVSEYSQCPEVQRHMIQLWVSHSPSFWFTYPLKRYRFFTPLWHQDASLPLTREIIQIPESLFLCSTRKLKAGSQYVVDNWPIALGISRPPLASTLFAPLPPPSGRSVVSGIYRQFDWLHNLPLAVDQRSFLIFPLHWLMKRLTQLANTPRRRHCQPATVW